MALSVNTTGRESVCLAGNKQHIVDVYYLDPHSCSNSIICHHTHDSQSQVDSNVGSIDGLRGLLHMDNRGPLGLDDL